MGSGRAGTEIGARMSDEHRWRARLAGAGALAVFASAAVALPAEAAPDYSLADTNYAGTQIALHEGVQGSGRADPAGQTLGHDVSGHQGAVDWPAAAAAGAKFTYVKATEGT